MIQVGREENQAFPPAPLPFFPFPFPREGNQAFPFPSPSFFPFPYGRKSSLPLTLGKNIESSLPLPSFPLPSSSLDFRPHQLDIIPPPPGGEGIGNFIHPCVFYNVIKPRGSTRKWTKDTKFFVECQQ